MGVKRLKNEQWKEKKRRISKGMAWSLVGAILLVGVLVYAIMCCYIHNDRCAIALLLWK